MRLARRSAYTLFELLLVLALLVFVAGMGLSAIRGPWETRQLRAAAESVRSGLGRVRNASIRDGTPYLVVCEPEANRLTVGPWTGLVAVQSSSNATTSSSGEVDVSDASADHRAFEIELPETVVVQSAVVAGADAGGPNAVVPQQILFFPDGTSSDAEVVLRNNQWEAMAVTLHGMTGACDLGTVFALEQSSR